MELNEYDSSNYSTYKNIKSNDIKKPIIYKIFYTLFWYILTQNVK